MQRRFLRPHALFFQHRLQYFVLVPAVDARAAEKNRRRAGDADALRLLDRIKCVFGVLPLGERGFEFRGIKAHALGGVE